MKTPATAVAGYREMIARGTLPDKQEAPAAAGSGSGGRYAHIVEPAVHPTQGLCGWDGTSAERLGPQPPICPRCKEIYDRITDPKDLEL